MRSEQRAGSSYTSNFRPEAANTLQSSSGLSTPRLRKSPGYRVGFLAGRISDRSGRLTITTGVAGIA